MDWDGDNILTDGAIIDYGSVRQFGLYHHCYRYDDVDKFSTTITQQKKKAKYIVQTFAQLADFLITKRKKNLKTFHKHKILQLFDEMFEQTKDELALYKIGFGEKSQKLLLQDKEAIEQLKAFRKICSYFEKVKTRRRGIQSYRWH